MSDRRTVTGPAPTDRLRSAIEAPTLVATGGYAGASLRHVGNGLVPGPWGIAFINAVGAFALGLLLYDRIHGGRFDRRHRLVLGSGVLSSFTTYSTFAHDVAGSSLAGAVALVVATYGFGFGGVVVAGVLVRRRVRTDGYTGGDA